MFSPAQLEFIERQRVAHLATAGAAGTPHVIPVCFAHVDGHFYIAIDEKPKRSLKLRRLRNIEENPRAALVFDRYDEDWQRLGWVLVRGRAVVLEGGEEHARALASLRERYTQYETMALESRPVIRITAERVSSWGDLS
jgi:PPOX class probable F420-dependent enzyme